MRNTPGRLPGSGTSRPAALDLSPGFAVRTDFVARYAEQQVGASVHRELWIPAEDLAEMNRNIVGLIEVIAEYKREAQP